MLASILIPHKEMHTHYTICLSQLSVHVYFYFPYRANSAIPCIPSYFGYTKLYLAYELFIITKNLCICLTSLSCECLHQ